MRTTNLCTLTADEIFGVIDHIEKFAPDKEHKRDFALDHVRDFLVDFPLEKEIEIFSYIEQRDYLQLTAFIENNPTLVMNLDGDSKKPQTSGAEVKELALNTSYNLAKKSKSTTKTRQLIMARELNNLKTVNALPYSIEKKMIVNNYSNNKLFDSLKIYENELAEYNIDTFLAKLLAYIRKHPKQTIFLEYVLYYLDVVRLDKTNVTSLKGEYLDRIREVIENKS